MAIAIKNLPMRTKEIYMENIEQNEKSDQVDRLKILNYEHNTKSDKRLIIVITSLGIQNNITKSKRNAVDN